MHGPRSGTDRPAPEVDLGTGTAAAALLLVAVVAGASLLLVVLAGRGDTDRAFTRRGDQRPALESTRQEDEVEHGVADRGLTAVTGPSLEALLADVDRDVDARRPIPDTADNGTVDQRQTSDADPVVSEDVAFDRRTTGDNPVAADAESARVDDREAGERGPAEPDQAQGAGAAGSVTGAEGATAPAGDLAATEPVSGPAGGEAESVPATVSAPSGGENGVEEGPLLTNEALVGPGPDSAARRDTAESAGVGERAPQDGSRSSGTEIGTSAPDGAVTPETAEQRPTLVLVESPAEPDTDTPIIDRLILIADAESATLQWGYAGAESDIGGFVVSWTSEEGERGQITVADASRRSITLTELVAGSDYTIDLAVLTGDSDVAVSSQLSGQIQVG